MAGKWTAQDYVSLIIATTASLSLLILVLGTVILASIGKLPVELLGKVEGIGIGGGFIGLAYILFLTVRVSTNKTNPRPRGPRNQ